MTQVCRQNMEQNYRNSMKEHLRVGERAVLRFPDTGDSMPMRRTGAERNT